MGYANLPRGTDKRGKAGQMVTVKVLRQCEKMLKSFFEGRKEQI